MTPKEELVSNLFYEGLISEDDVDLLLDKEMAFGSIPKPGFTNDATGNYIAIVYSLN